MWDRDKVLTAFRQAVTELNETMGNRILRPRKVGLRAHGIYCASLNPGEKNPSPETFRKFATGQLPLSEISTLFAQAGIARNPPARLDRSRLRSVFEEAIQRLESRLLKGQAKSRQIVRRAHELYTKDADGTSIQPSRRTFEWLVYGKTADAEIRSLVETALTKPKKD